MKQKSFYTVGVFLLVFFILPCMAKESEVFLVYQYHIQQSLTFNRDYLASIGNILVTNVGRENVKFRHNEHTPKVYLYDKVTEICYFTNHLVLDNTGPEETISILFSLLDSSLYYYLISGKQTRIFKAYIDVNSDVHFNQRVSFINKNHENLEYHFFTPVTEFTIFDTKGCPLREPDFKIQQIQLLN